MSICPHDKEPCCDDLCYGSGCLRMNGYPMLHRCVICGGLEDEENPDCGSCSCDADEFPDEESK